MLALKIFPITRSLGALKNTLAPAQSLGHAVLLDHDAVTEIEREAYANEIRRALNEKAWERIDFDPEIKSWEKVADQWIDVMGLKG